MMSDLGINILQLRMIFCILRHKIATKLFEPEIKMKDLCGEIIQPQFVEYKYVHKVGSKPEVILYWVRDTIII